MYVRQLIGREAGNIIVMPYSAATSCLAMGTVAEVTDEEIEAAGLEVEVFSANLPDALPHGFRVEALPEGGFDLYDPGGVNLSADISLPNMVAARDYAHSIVNPVDAAPTLALPAPTAFDKLSKAELLQVAESAHVEVPASAKKADIIAALIDACINAPEDVSAATGGEDQSGAEGGGDAAEGAADGDAIEAASEPDSKEAQA
ncbi:Rho termination factor N-terminal domain-containing protein [Rhizobium sp. L51/94]|uniref:Rho termination factor N-terminal domain-containing protein n=1 Tax=Rhizobium sp. L51/94 TaxID=2819999 RepID=UPI001C5AF4C6|nr:Rho termination factor N-terminal domain-containing protein [Rhizobium sp. L51/94]QXZ79658.1 hypothetical protein J5274_06660 [Rhizobium sp. L51/94]